MTTENKVISFNSLLQRQDEIVGAGVEALLRQAEDLSWDADVATWAEAASAWDASRWSWWASVNAFLADGIVTTELTAHINAFLAILSTETVGVDAESLLQKAFAFQASFDAMLEHQGITQTVQLDSLKQKEFNVVSQVNSALQKLVLITLNTDTLLERQEALQLSFDAIIALDTIPLTAFIDALLQASPIIQLGFDAWLTTSGWVEQPAVSSQWSKETGLGASWVEKPKAVARWVSEDNHSTTWVEDTSSNSTWHH